MNKTQKVLAWKLSSFRASNNSHEDFFRIQEKLKNMALSKMQHPPNYIT